MSLPATHSQISTNPDKMAVTAANNPAVQQADVERKLKLYGVIQAFREGKMPDNQQINEALDFAIKHSPVELQKLSPDGKLLVEDIRDILESARMMIAEKNQGELFQNFVYASTKGDISRGQKSKSELLPVSKDDAAADAQQGAAHLRTLFTLFVTNSEARKLSRDVGYIARDLFATGAAKAAENVRPDEGVMDQVDKPAPKGEFISEDGKKVGKNETPILHVKGPSGTEIRMNPKDDPANAQVTDHQGNTRTAGETANVAQDAYQQTKDQAYQAKDQAQSQAQGAYDQQGGSQGLKEQARSHAEDVRQSDSPLDTARAKKDQAKNVADENTPDSNQTQGTKDKLLSKIPDEHREKLNEQVDKTKDFLNENFPQERRDNFIYRLKKVVVECQEHKDYQEAMQWLLDTAENYTGHAKTVANHGADSAQNVAQDPAYNQATLQFRTLLERFANNQSMQPLIDSIDRLYSDAQNDRELRQWWSQVNEYAHSALLEPGFLLEEESDKQARDLQETGKYFFNDKYKGHFDSFSNEVQTFFLAMGDDPLNQRFGEDWKRLVKDLLFDDAGDLTYKPRLWNDIRRVVAPAIFSNIGYIPIPRCEYADSKIELVIENLVLQGENLMPNRIFLDARNQFDFSPIPKLNSQLDSHHHTMRMQLSQIQADIRDVQFAFKRLSGWPKLSDHGLADVVIAGKGISVDVTIESVSNRRDQVFKVQNIDIDIDTMKFSIRDSKHDLLYKFIKGVATGVIKKAIQAAIHQAIKTGLEYLDDELVEVRNRLDDAKRDDNEETRTTALKNMYREKKQSAQEKAQKADEKTGKFTVVLDPEDSVVKDLDEARSKHSWTKRAFNVADAAGAGNDWKSPVFSLFSAKHPASTGTAHPAVQNPSVQGTGTSATSATAESKYGTNVQ